MTSKIRTTRFVTVSSKDLGIESPSSARGKERVRTEIGVPYDELEARRRNAVYGFVNGTFNEKIGAAHHYYRADQRRLSEMDSGNYLIALNFLSMYDLYGDEEMLRRAARCFDWAYENSTETHPMFTWQGGVRDNFRPNELYVKYTCDGFLTALALHARSPKDRYMFAVQQFHNFIKGARRAGFCFKFDTHNYRWTDLGFSWNGFGGPVLSYLQLWDLTGHERCLEHAVAWGGYGIKHQAPDGGLYLIDDFFWNSDLTPLELRGLVFLYEATGREEFIDAAERFAKWVLSHQREDGAWPIGIDREGDVCAPNVGPGDASNIAISLVLLHRVTGDHRYLEGAARAVRYAVTMQAVEGGTYPLHLDDPKVRWGFWSWDPLYDCTLSGDQVVHHVRAMNIVADYLASL